MRPCGDSMKTWMPRLPRIAYSAALPVSPEVAPRMLSVCPRRASLVLEQRAQQLHRQVLEGQRRAVGQRPARTRPARAGVSGTIASLPKTSSRVGRGAACAQVGRRDVVDVERQDLERQVGVGRAAASAPASRRRRAGSCVGRYRPPSGARPSSRISQKPRSRRIAARADVSHRHAPSRQFFLAHADDRRQHRRQRLHRAMRFAHAAFDRVVREDDHVGLALAFGALALQQRRRSRCRARPGCVVMRDSTPGSSATRRRR